ncbi:MAG: N-acetylmuramoyl-L-alanine amidase family protein [Bacillota bacterium]|nr:N-acetylmuramoyl-L-alanine amidase family protein [Bacillota bacterium]
MNGAQVFPDVPLLVNAGRMVVPIRIIAENLGATVEWDAARNAAVVDGGGRLVDLPVGSAVATVNGQQVALDAPSVLYSGRTMVPLRFVAEALGCDVAWNGDTRAASVTSPSGGQLIDVQFALGQDRALLLVRTGSQASYTAKTLDDPPRLIVDLVGVEPRTGWSVKEIGQALVQRVRLTEMASTPKTTRVILDLEEPVRFTSRQATDFPGVIVEIQYKVSGVAWEAGGLTISGTGPLPSRSFTLSEPDRYVIDLPNTNLAGGARTVEVAASDVLRARIAQFQSNPDIVRVVLDLAKPVQFQIAQADKGLRVVPEGSPGSQPPPPQPPPPSPPVPELASAAYETTSGGGRLFVQRAGAAEPKVTVSADGRELWLQMPECTLGAAAERQVNDGVVVSYALAAVPSGGSMVLVKLPGYIGHKLVHDASAGTVTLDITRSPVVGRKIAIDPGHGGVDPGAISVTKVYEREVNLAIANVLKQRLERAGAQVLMTREDATTSINAYGRAAAANEWGADVLVSVHCNSHTSRATSGTEVWHYGNSAESLRLAGLMIQQLRGLGLVDRGVKKDNYAILRETSMPAVLVETGFLSNPTEEKLLLNPVFQAKAAELMCQALLAFFR